MQEENRALQDGLKQLPSRVGAFEGMLAPDSQRRAPPAEDCAASTQETKFDTTGCQKGTEGTETAALGVWDRKEPLVIVVLQSDSTVIQVPPCRTLHSFPLPAALAQPEPVREHSWRRLRTLHTRPILPLACLACLGVAPWRGESAALVKSGPLGAGGWGRDLHACAHAQ